MAARKEQNLLEQALRIAQGSGRSHQARLVSLLRLATRTLGLSSATVFLPNQQLDTLTQRFSDFLPVADSGCRIPFGQGCSGRAALSLRPASLPANLLHGDEPCPAGAQSFLVLPVRVGKRLLCVFSLGGAEAKFARTTVSCCKRLAPVLAILLTGLADAERACRERRDLSLIASLGKLLNNSHPPKVMLPKLLRLCTEGHLALGAIIRLSEGNAEIPRIFQHCRREASPLLAEMLRAEASLSERAVTGAVACSETPALAGAGCHAFSTPLACNGRHLGTMTFFGGSELLDPEQLQLAETVARLLSSALGEAISAQRILSFASENDKKLKELSLLYKMSNTMLSTIRLNKLIHLTLTALTSGPAPFFDRATLFLSNERSGYLLGMLGVTRESSPPLSFQHGGDDILSSRWDISADDMAAQRKSEFCREVLGMRLKLDSAANVASQAVLEKKLIHLAGETAAGEQPPHQGRGPALAASPLLAHGKAVGAVMVDKALSKAPISQEDLRFLQLFTNQAGMAIENSMLFHKLEDANRLLGEAQENLLQKERLAAIGEMAAGIAHELKGPLVSIGGFAGRLSRKLHHGSQEWGHADLIMREVQRLEGILSEILLFSKKPSICYNRCSLPDLVKETLAVVGPPLEEKGIAVRLRLPRRELTLLGDGQQLKQVFINIILNAIDAMGNGGKLDIQVSPGELEGKKAVQVKIGDTGGGIPVESLGSIFTPFYTTKESGTGLGLPIANRIVTNHGGKIHVVNTPGKGAEFQVILPKHW